MEGRIPGIKDEIRREDLADGGECMVGRVPAGRVEMDTEGVAGDREHREGTNPAVHA